MICVRVSLDDYVDGTIKGSHTLGEFPEYCTVSPAIDKHLNAGGSLYEDGVALPYIKKRYGEIGRPFFKHGPPYGSGKCHKHEEYD